MLPRTNYPRTPGQSGAGTVIGASEDAAAPPRRGGATIICCEAAAGMCTLARRRRAVGVRPARPFWGLFMSMRRPLRYLKRATLILLLCVAIGIPFAPALARRIIRSRLQTMIATQLNARLEIDDLTYKFPYGVEVDGAQLVTDGPDARPLALLTVPHLSIHLARSPLRSGPLVIESLIVDR